MEGPESFSKKIAQCLDRGVTYLRHRQAYATFLEGSCKLLQRLMKLFRKIMPCDTASKGTLWNLGNL